jgi:hypothetical protein
VNQVPTTTIDAEWQAPLDVLKLSVNGAELKTLRGARKLLTQRKVCMVMMHATKVQLGRDRPDFATDLYDILNDNGMEILFHKDRDETGSSTTDRIQSAGKMEAIFTGEPVISQDYIFARLPSPECQDVNSHLQI